MLDARRPYGWLFLLLTGLVALTVSAQNLPTTTISDTVYRADGTPAGGVLLISWPEFTTAALGAVAAGNTSVTLGAGVLCLLGWFLMLMRLQRIPFTPSFTNWMTTA
jgi:hypothetical protein